MRHSILWRILFPYILLLLGVLTALSLFLSGALRSTYLERTEARLFAEAHLVRSQVEPLILANPTDPQINQIAENAARLLGNRVTIILADGRVVGESEKPFEELPSHFDRPEVQQALLNKEDTEIRYSDTLKTDLLYAAVPLTEQGKVVAIVRLAAPLTAIQNSLNVLYGSVAAAALVAAALAALIAILITRSTLRPLSTLSRAVEQIGAGVLPEIGEPKRKDEVSQLQLAFRGMTQKLQ